VVLASPQDDSGAIQALVDSFAGANTGIDLVLRQMPREVDAYYRELVSELGSGSAEIDVIAADVPWTAPLVHAGFVEDLSNRFYESYEVEDFVEPALRSAAYRIRVWGVPWYTDAGLLFYRKDLIGAHGYDGPPATWSDLETMAKKIQGADGVRHGYVFQGAEYAGGVANALEFIWNAGGRVATLNVSVAGTPGQNVMAPNVIQVDTQQAASGWGAARHLIAEGVAPVEVTTYREIETWESFFDGEAVFMRNWPAAVSMAKGKRVSPDQVGVAPIPALSAGSRRFGCLGGWNLMINKLASAKNKEAGWRVIRHFTAAERQRRFAQQGGFLPTRKALYQDADLTARKPVLAHGRKAVEDARNRPVSPRYMDMSPRIAHAFHRTLLGKVAPERAVSDLSRELRAIVGRR